MFIVHCFIEFIVHSFIEFIVHSFIEYIGHSFRFLITQPDIRQKGKCICNRIISSFEISFRNIQVNFAMTYELT